MATGQPAPLATLRHANRLEVQARNRAVTSAPRNQGGGLNDGEDDAQPTKTNMQIINLVAPVSRTGCGGL
jgi:hypothetical protein